MMPTLGETIASARKAQHMTQSQLAKEIETSNKVLSQIENGNPPSLKFLVRIHEKLLPQGDISFWVLKWAQENLGKEGLKSDRMNFLKEALSSLAIYKQPPDLRIHKSLEYFPSRFLPLIIICGDRRESSPKTGGDLLAYSVSIADLTFLLDIDWPVGAVVIRTDKIIQQGNIYLESKLGKANLLVIGSPAVNLLAREINKYSIFRFVQEAELKGFQERLASIGDLNAQDLQEFAKLIQLDPFPIDTPNDEGRLGELKAKAKDVLGVQTAKYWMNSFRKPGFVDPVRQRIQGSTTASDTDFGVISLSKNPWSASGEHVAILVGGIHGPGTAHAVRALAQHEEFKSHPYGGIIEVDIDNQQDWPTKFETARWKWETPDYTVDSLRENLWKEIEETGLLAKDEISQCLELISRLSSENI